MLNWKRGLNNMCNWLIKFKGTGSRAVWISVFCETSDEAAKLSEAIENNTDLKYDYEIICIGTGQE